MLNDFKEDFILRYEDITKKVLVGLKIANTRFESNMKFGDNVNRFVLDLSAVRVRPITNLQDRTMDPITDSTETMPITIKSGLSFPISHSEEVQAGPLSPAMVAGKQIAIKINTYLDAQILAETKNASTTFDTGSLTGGVATGVPFALNSTTVPQMVTMADAALFALNNDNSNTVWVMDPVSLGLIAQFPIGKDITSANATFMNGFKGNLYGSEIYVTNNLTGEAVLTASDVFVDTQTVTIGGVVFTSEATPTTAGSFDVSTVANSLGYLANLINNPDVTNATQIALSTANQIKIKDTLGLSAVATATTLTIVGKGSSRLAVSETQTNVAWTSNFVHVYFGQKGAIDVAIQEKPDVWTREEPKQRTTNYFVDVVAAIKTFSDGAVKFIDVKVSA